MPDEAVTPDPLEAVRANVDAMNRRDFDAAVANYAPDAVLDAEALGTFEGREAIRGFLEEWFGTYEDLDQELEEFRDFGNGVGFAVFLWRGRLKGSSGFTEFRFASVAVSADGLVERLTTRPEVGQLRVAAERLAEERG